MTVVTSHVESEDISHESVFLSRQFDSFGAWLCDTKNEQLENGVPVSMFPR
ncbi:TPA: hypothetical protein ACUISS_005308 [Klebsiella pneumoniae]